VTLLPSNGLNAAAFAAMSSPALIVTYCARLIRFLPGAMKVEVVAAAAPPPLPGVV